jgi:5-methylcytosine-specific restriction endonuclease McrA
VYCNKVLGFGSYDFELDHIIPWANGGQNTITNLVTACVPCNRKKSNKTLEQAGMALKYGRFSYERELKRQLISCLMIIIILVLVFSFVLWKLAGS